jgi:hypothetical protein
MQPRNAGFTLRRETEEAEGNNKKAWPADSDSEINKRGNSERLFQQLDLVLDCTRGSAGPAQGTALEMTGHKPSSAALENQRTRGSSKKELYAAVRLRGVWREAVSTNAPFCPL